MKINKYLLYYTASPSAPLNLTVSSESDTTLKLKWEKPQNDGGSPVTCYVIKTYILTKSGKQEVRHMRTRTRHRNIILRPYNYSESLLFEVAARNKFGVGGRAVCEYCTLSRQSVCIICSQELILILPFAKYVARMKHYV